MDRVETLRDVRDHFSEVLEAVDMRHERVVITRYGRPVVALLAIAELHQLDETVAGLSKPALLRDLISALELVTTEEPVEQVGAVEPVEPVGAAGLVEPVGAAEPVEPDEPVGAEEWVEPVEPVGAEEWVESVEPVGAEEGLDPERPGQQALW